MEDLGPYVIGRPRKDGTLRVSFEVPARLRPDGWPATIPLPIMNRTGALDDIERRAIRKDAEDLVAMMKSKRSDRPTTRRISSWADLVASYEASDAFLRLKPASKFTYSRYISKIVETLDGHTDLTPDRITESQVEAFLMLFDHSPDAKKNALSVMRNLLQKAVREGIRPSALEVKTRARRPVRKIGIWEQEDVDDAVEACVTAGHNSLAALILTQWEIGQRLTDARLFRYGHQYYDGAFRFDQSKTDQYVTIPAPRLRSLLGADGELGAPLFPYGLAGRPYSSWELSYYFRQIRNDAGLSNDRKLTLRSLRHSCVIQLARAGCTIAEIRSTTGHALRSVYAILEHYLPRDNLCAWNAVEKRNRMRDEGSTANIMVEGDLRTFIGDRPSAPL